MRRQSNQTAPAGNRPVAAARPLIVERPDLQSRAQRFGYLTVTFLCWFLWLYLFVPLLSLLAWALGATLVYRVMLQQLQPAELLVLLKVYGSGAALLSSVYLLWAVTSWLRFRNVERRQTPPAATDEALAASHRLSASELTALRQSRRLVVEQALLLRMFAPDTASPATEPAPHPVKQAGARH